MKLRSGEWLVLGGTILILALAVFAGKLVMNQPPRVYYVYHESPDTLRGETIYRHEGCNACHKVFGNGYGYGPSLDGVGSHRTRDWLRRYLLEPWPGVSKRRYRVEMPGYEKLSTDELESLMDYLLALKENVEKGEL